MGMIKRPVLRYHGGKFELANWIISHFPPHRSYIEPFGGAASVLLLKQRSRVEVYNDTWEIVVNVFRVLRDPDLNRRLREVLELTPYARSEFNATTKDLLTKDMLTDRSLVAVEQARQTILRSFASFGSAATNAEHATGFRANNRSNGTNCAIDWHNYPYHLSAFCQRLQGVVIEKKDYRLIMEQQDATDALFYLDPPYVHATRNVARGNAYYACEMTDADHIEMAEFLKKIKGKVLISGYDNELYQDLFKDWYFTRRAALADGANKRIECLWANYKFDYKLF